MNMIDALLGSQADGVVSQIGQQFGLNQSQATSAITALLPALAAGLNHNASSQSGLDALLGALGSGQHQQYVDDIQSLGRAATIDDGNGILGHVFGSKDVSRQVAHQAAAQSGIGADVLKKMLPILATVLMGALAKGQLWRVGHADRVHPGAGRPGRRRQHPRHARAVARRRRRPGGGSMSDRRDRDARQDARRTLGADERPTARSDHVAERNVRCAEADAERGRGAIDRRGEPHVDPGRVPRGCPCRI